MLEQAKDFKDESETLFALINPLSDADFERPTLFKGWTFNDILGHLHHGNMLADLSLNDEAKFHETYAKIKALRDAGAEGTDATATVLEGLKGRALLAAWRDFYGPMSDRFAEADPKKKWSCGNKGQKACPMQGWMKGVMARAMASGDSDKIAKALNTIAAKPVAGYGQWTGIAAEGAAKAQAGDIDGAKASCKKCHALYQKKYIATMRDQPW